MSWDEFYKSIQEAYHIEDEATVIKIPVGNIIEITQQRSQTLAQAFLRCQG